MLPLLHPPARMNESIDQRRGQGATEKKRVHSPNPTLPPFVPLPHKHNTSHHNNPPSPCQHNRPTPNCSALQSPHDPPSSIALPWDIGARYQRPTGFVRVARNSGNERPWASRSHTPPQTPLLFLSPAIHPFPRPFIYPCLVHSLCPPHSHLIQTLILYQDKKK